MNPITEILQKFGIDSVDLIRSAMAAKDRNATGKTSESILWQTPTDTHLIVDAPSYIFAVETGRGPRKSSQNANLKSKLLQWVQARSITWAGKTSEQIASFLTWYINKYGTKLYREGGVKDIITPALAETRIDELSMKISDVAVGQVLKTMNPYVK